MLVVGVKNLFKNDEAKNVIQRLIVFKGAFLYFVLRSTGQLKADDHALEGPRQLANFVAPLGLGHFPLQVSLAYCLHCVCNAFQRPNEKKYAMIRRKKEKTRPAT